MEEKRWQPPNLGNASAMHPMIDWILKNREWIFSGVGVFLMTGAVWLLRRLFVSKFLRADGGPGTASRPGLPGNESQRYQFSRSRVQGGSAARTPDVVPANWQGILPAQSRYAFAEETSDSIPLGLQSFSFEYGPHGHANALTLKGTIVRAEIQFTCQIVNPYKAMFSANEYALNVLQPRFLVQARNVLEKFSLTKLREGRQDIARDIRTQISPQFEELGVRLESVTIGALDKIGPVK